MRLVSFDSNSGPSADARNQSVQLVRYLEMIKFNASLDFPLLGISLSANFSHISSGIKPTLLTRQNFDMICSTLHNHPFSANSIVMQNQVLYPLHSSITP